jgi:tripeptide aminopeptidase
VRGELDELGLAVDEDGAGQELGGDCGNLLTRVPGPREDSPCVLLCAHLDTVPAHAPLEPRLVDGVWENAGDGILGADNKAAVAALLVIARRLVEQGAPCEVELLFTVAEEISLRGSAAFDRSRLRSAFGFVFDHATPIGGVVTASPTHYRLAASFAGQAAHAGLEPERGRSAVLAAARAVCELPQGRLDAESTLNISRIEGGGAINVVPDACRIAGELRSLDAAHAEELAADFVAACGRAANLPDCDVDVDVSCERTFTGYRHPEASPALELARSALRACGHEPFDVASGGGSDANSFMAAGLPVVNIANGTEHAHQPSECVSEANLTAMLPITWALLEQAGR